MKTRSLSLSRLVGYAWKVLCWILPHMLLFKQLTECCIYGYWNEKKQSNSWHSPNNNLGCASQGMEFYVGECLQEFRPCIQELVNIWRYFYGSICFPGSSHEISRTLSSSANHFEVCNSQEICPSGEVLCFDLPWICHLLKFWWNCRVLLGVFSCSYGRGSWEYCYKINFFDRFFMVF